jgi:hypothetical protein
MSSTIHGQSHQAIKHFRDNPAALAIYWIYCSRVNEDNVAWPSLAGLARDTGWSRQACQNARVWLISHGALRVVEKYVRPEWLKLAESTQKRKVNLDRSIYLRPTGLIEADDKTYHLLYIPQREKSDIEAFEPGDDSLPDRLSYAVDGQGDSPELSTSSTEHDTKKDISPQNGDSAPEEKAETSAKKERPRNLWYDVVLEVFGLSAELNGRMQNILRGKETRKSYKQYNVEPPLTEPDEVRQWAKWWRAQGNNKNLEMVSSIAKVQSSIMTWQHGGKVTPEERPEPEDPYENWVLPGMMPTHGAKLLDIEVHYGSSD